MANLLAQAACSHILQSLQSHLSFLADQGVVGEESLKIILSELCNIDPQQFSPPKPAPTTLATRLAEPEPRASQDMTDLQMLDLPSHLGRKPSVSDMSDTAAKANATSQLFVPTDDEEDKSEVVEVVSREHRPNSEVEFHRLLMRQALDQEQQQLLPYDDTDETEEDTKDKSQQQQQQEEPHQQQDLHQQQQQQEPISTAIAEVVDVTFTTATTTTFTAAAPVSTTSPTLSVSDKPELPPLLFSSQVSPTISTLAFDQHTLDATTTSTAFASSALSPAPVPMPAPVSAASFTPAPTPAPITASSTPAHVAVSAVPVHDEHLHIAAPGASLSVEHIEQHAKPSPSSSEQQHQGHQQQPPISSTANLVPKQTNGASEQQAPHIAGFEHSTPESYHRFSTVSQQPVSHGGPTIYQPATTSTAPANNNQLTPTNDIIKELEVSPESPAPASLPLQHKDSYRTTSSVPESNFSGGMDTQQPPTPPPKDNSSSASTQAWPAASNLASPPMPNPNANPLNPLGFQPLNLPVQPYQLYQPKPYQPKPKTTQPASTSAPSASAPAAAPAAAPTSTPSVEASHQPTQQQQPPMQPGQPGFGQQHPMQHPLPHEQQQRQPQPQPQLHQQQQQPPVPAGSEQQHQLYQQQYHQQQQYQAQQQQFPPHQQPFQQQQQPLPGAHAHQLHLSDSSGGSASHSSTPSTPEPPKKSGKKWMSGLKSTLMSGKDSLLHAASKDKDKEKDKDQPHGKDTKAFHLHQQQQMQQQLQQHNHLTPATDPSFYQGHQQPPFQQQQQVQTQPGQNPYGFAPGQPGHPGQPNQQQLGQPGQPGQFGQQQAAQFGQQGLMGQPGQQQPAQIPLQQQHQPSFQPQPQPQPQQPSFQQQHQQQHQQQPYQAPARTSLDQGQAVPASSGTSAKENFNRRMSSLSSTSSRNQQTPAPGLAAASISPLSSSAPTMSAASAAFQTVRDSTAATPVNQQQNQQQQQQQQQQQPHPYQVQETQQTPSVKTDMAKEIGTAPGSPLSDNASHLSTVSETKTIEILVRAQALYDFPGEDEGDLKFKAGDIISVIQYLNDDWWKGIHRSDIGIFPTAYVKPLKTPKDGNGSVSIEVRRSIYGSLASPSLDQEPELNQQPQQPVVQQTNKHASFRNNYQPTLEPVVSGIVSPFNGEGASEQQAPPAHSVVTSVPGTESNHTSATPTSPPPPTSSSAVPPASTPGASSASFPTPPSLATQTPPSSVFGYFPGAGNQPPISPPPSLRNQPQPGAFASPNGFSHGATPVAGGTALANGQFSPPMSQGGGLGMMPSVGQQQQNQHRFSTPTSPTSPTGYGNFSPTNPHHSMIAGSSAAGSPEPVAHSQMTTAQLAAAAKAKKKAGARW